jgi:hypothetical protein
MLKWLTNFIDDTRISFAYFYYENECRKAWVADAKHVYSTENIRQDIAARMVAPMLYVSTSFDVPISLLERDLQDIAQTVSDAKAKLAILVRDYKDELDRAYVTLNEIRERLGVCKQGLSGAYDDLKNSKRDLDSWYSKAEGNWFGNGGKKLPDHAFFGQDLGDRDRYKSRRDSAAREISSYNAERSSLGERFNEARNAVQQIKDARQKMFDLKKAGFDKRVVNAVIDRGHSETRLTYKQIAQLTELRTAYLKQAKEELGVKRLEAEITRLIQACQTQIKTFDTESATAVRKARHREEWMAARGR